MTNFDTNNNFNENPNEQNNNVLNTEERSNNTENFNVQNTVSNEAENVTGEIKTEAKPEADNTLNHTEPHNRTENPYFRGYGDYRQTGAQFDYQNRNTQNNANQQVNNQQSYQPNYSQQSYNQPNNAQNYSNQYGNSYVPNHRYDAPVQQHGQISYTPADKPKKEKKSKPVTRGALVAVLAAAIILSGCVGFGGAMLANSVFDKGETVVVDNNGSVTASNSANTGGNVVIYRSVDEVATSAGNSANGTYTYAEVASMVKDSVVEITTEFNTTSYGWYNYVQQGAGSGVIISVDGYIVTNTHVITNESTGAIADSITVRLTNGEEYKAEVIGYDADEDIAIIKINATGLTAAQCGDSDKLAVGEELVIVGNPLGELGGTVTNGIVSATEREIEVNGVTMNLIQTNAAVNPGNSGGGMFNMKGQLVGIVNAKSSGTGIEGLGFAIPINKALNVTEQLLEYGYVRGKTMIGVTFSEISSNNFFYYYNLKAGVYVDSLTKGYNDDVLQVGDRVVAINESTISSYSEIKAIVTSASVGDKLTFQVERNGKLMEVEVECFEKVPDTQNNIEFDDSQTENTSNKDISGRFN